MDRLTRNVWRAFWVGLGVSAVLVVQAFLPATGTPSPEGDPWAAPRLEGSKMGPLARPLRTTEPALTPAVSRARAKIVKPGA